MKEEKIYNIYKDGRLIATRTEYGWAFFTDEKKWLLSFIKNNKDKIKDYGSLKKMILSCYVGDVLSFFKRK